MKNFFNMKKQAEKLQQDLSQMQEKLKTLEVEGISENNLVTITLSGEKKIKKIKIDPKCVDSNDVEGLEDLIMSAYNKACDKVEKESSSSMDAFKGLMPF
ncbi:MAG: Nucleoid-associated protein [Candidatus Anoxychlamydiales bacterium]|nr:Nucleoid-associated protein [Candidatus Anoxychlamydiales bacterium]